MGRLVKLSELSPTERINPDSVKRRSEAGSSRNIDILLQGRTDWDSLDYLRKQTDRVLRYYLGDGWSDKVPVPGKGEISEEDYIKSQGKVPLQQNILRHLGRRIIGAYRSNDKVPICSARDKAEEEASHTMNDLLGYNWELNKSKGAMARTMEYMLCSAVAARHHWFGSKNGVTDCWNEELLVDRLFWDPAAQKNDLSDARRIGYLYDMPLAKVLSQFAHSPREYQLIVEAYRYASNPVALEGIYRTFGKQRLETYDFFIPEDPAMCRVIAMWTLEQKPAIYCHDWLKGDWYHIDLNEMSSVKETNAARIAEYAKSGIPENEVPLIETEWKLRDYWYYRYLTPTGIVLAEGETPYNHGKPPIVVKIYSMIGGRVRSMFAEMLDIQRMVNRLATKYSWIIDAAAKGTLMMADDAISDMMPIEEVRKQYAKVGGVVLYNANTKIGAPTQVSSNNTNIGIMELLNFNLKMIEDIASVNGAMQGKPGYSGTSGTLYAQQTQNSLMGLLDLMEEYDEFVVDNARMLLSNIQQYYDPQKVIEIVGLEAEDVTAQAEKVLNIAYDINVTQSTSSAIYKERANEWLMRMLELGVVNLEPVLEVGHFPFGERLLQAIKEQQQQLAKGEEVQPLPQDLMNEVQQGADMNTVQRLYDAMKRQAA